MIDIRLLWVSITLAACGERTINASVTKADNNTEQQTDDNVDDDLTDIVEDDQVDTANESSDEDEEDNQDVDTSQDNDTNQDNDTGQDNDNPNANMVSDFTLVDMNSGSPLYGQDISPRDYLQQTTGWYFIKAT